MTFCGYGKIFSTENNAQYNAIGAFWEEMSAIFGLENLCGLGFNWAKNTIEYLIGLKSGKIPSNLKISNYEYKEVKLPDSGWSVYQGKREELDKLYKEIYKAGALQYEIEEFYDNGACIVKIYGRKL